MLRSIGVISLVLISTVACVPVWQTKPNISPESLFETRYKNLIELEQWKIKGRTVITQDKEAWNVGLRWQEDRGNYQIKLEGPFSQGGVTLEGKKGHVVLTTADGKKLSATNPEALLMEAAGWNLPVSALRDWVKGIPYRKETFESVNYDDKGRITTLVQQGWNVEFLRYVPFGSHSMPSKVFIKHPDLSLRLVITSWNDIK
ncbi:MAG: lipoprotein insertase outer membrane protein LolB [Gammaproteobacteria bacterium]|nr:lipoprotein insertase outer membrane protein LolB [Gammaproteobacteria bacterium]